MISLTQRKKHPVAQMRFVPTAVGPGARHCLTAPPSEQQSDHGHTYDFIQGLMIRITAR